MTTTRHLRLTLALGLALVPTGCKSGAEVAQAELAAEQAQGLIAVTIRSANGAHVFKVETARTAAEQERGLMFRTDIPENGGMLFWPYPPDGSPPREASFWMHNTPSPLDIVYIRGDGTIARIAENAVPQNDTPIPSGEPVGAVLELRGGRALELGIAEGDAVSWPRTGTDSGRK